MSATTLRLSSTYATGLDITFATITSRIGVGSPTPIVNTGNGYAGETLIGSMPMLFCPSLMRTTAPMSIVCAVSRIF